MGLTKLGNKRKNTQNILKNTKNDYKWPSTFGGVADRGLGSAEWPHQVSGFQVKSTIWTKEAPDDGPRGALG